MPIRMYFVRAFDTGDAAGLSDQGRGTTYVVFAYDQPEAIELVKRRYADAGHHSFTVDQGVLVTRIDHPHICGYAPADT